MSVSPASGEWSGRTAKVVGTLSESNEFKARMHRAKYWNRPRERVRYIKTRQALARCRSASDRLATETTVPCRRTRRTSVEHNCYRKAEECLRNQQRLRGIRTISLYADTDPYRSHWRRCRSLSPTRWRHRSWAVRSPGPGPWKCPPTPQYSSTTYSHPQTPTVERWVNFSYRRAGCQPRSSPLAAYSM